MRTLEAFSETQLDVYKRQNRNIAYDFYKIVKELRPEWTEKKICDDGVVLSEKDKKELKPMEKIKLVMTRNKDDEKDLFDMLGTKEDRKEFDRQFKNPKSKDVYKRQM